MRYPTFSAFKFDENSYTFDVREYSIFKHGSKRAAKSIAFKLFESYIQQMPSTNKEIVVFPSPYHFIPSACSLIKDEFLLLLNRWLVKQGRLPATQSVINRRLSYHTDYGKMSNKERESLISGDKFYLDEEFIKNKFCIFLDDVRITGSHERQVEKLLPKDVDYQVVYYAEYTGSGDSTIENYLNTNRIKSIVSLYPLIGHKDFVFNVRNIRLILTSDHFDEFIREQSDEFQIEMYDWCIGNHYHIVEVYRQNINILHNLISHLIN